MNIFNVPVEIDFGAYALCAASTQISFNFVAVQITSAQLQRVRELQHGVLTGLAGKLKFTCQGDDIAIHNKVYCAKCTSLFRLSANSYLLKFTFVGLDDAQHRELRRAVSTLQQPATRQAS